MPLKNSRWHWPGLAGQLLSPGRPGCQVSLHSRLALPLCLFASVQKCRCRCRCRCFSAGCLSCFVGHGPLGATAIPSPASELSSRQFWRARCPCRPRPVVFASPPHGRSSVSRLLHFSLTSRLPIATHSPSLPSHPPSPKSHPGPGLDPVFLVSVVIISLLVHCLNSLSIIHSQHILSLSPHLHNIYSYYILSTTSPPFPPFVVLQREIAGS